MILNNSKNLRYLLVALLINLCAFGQSDPSNVVIENYYKVKWGYAEEFIELWKTNHYPLLKKAQEKGDIIKIEAVKPAFHGGEDTRWDFKVTLTFKNLQTAFDPNLTVPFKKQLYPDAAALTKAEQHRFTLLLSHWDIIVQTVPL